MSRFSVSLVTAALCGLFVNGYATPALAAFASGEWTETTLGGLSALVYVPTQGSPADRAALIVLHGCQQNNTALQQRGNFEDAAEEQNTIIVLPNVPNGGVIAGCWDYYGTNHDKNTTPHKEVIALTNALKASDQVDFVAAQIYLGGLSSGASEAMLVGCLAPELYAGIIASAGPALGTESFEIGFGATDGASAADVCEEFAAQSNQAGQLNSQIVVLLQDPQDPVVSSDYLDINEEAYRSILSSGAALSTQNQTQLSNLGVGGNGAGRFWNDATGPRLAVLAPTGVGHAWVAGAGDGRNTNFVAQANLNAAVFGVDFIRTNQRRTTGFGEPIVDAGAPDAGDPEPVDAGDEPQIDGGANDLDAGGNSDDTDGGTGDVDPPSCGSCDATSTSENMLGFAMLSLLALRRSRRAHR